MTDHSNQRDLETSIRTDLKDRLDYSGYLDLDRILAAQHPLSEPPHHDELLFIIQHQTSELWFKLIIHELRSAIAHLEADDPGPCLKILARIKLVQQQLFDQWAVLETLTPSEYVQFRHVFGDASGFQSYQYRLVEFLLGNKNAQMLELFRHAPEVFEVLETTLHAPSLYDAFLAFLHRLGHRIPASCVERDYSKPHERTPELVPALVGIYRDTDTFWTEYALCERLIDVEESFQLWRFRHLKTVERIIGFKRGSGGSSGVNFLKKALDLTFFPELLDVRTEL
ncbi:tryptophan 2,3-dioxygenase [Leptolyngbya valderiana BDU 20041]|nr:tryptophan 2,3-dioxygenase [Leptolyngbya valderiana BDU 20041]